MRSYKLSEHRFSRGVFTTPFYDFFKKQGSARKWFLSTLPEVLWLGLILNSFERTKGLMICIDILKFLENLSEEFVPPYFSEILKLESHSKTMLFDYISSRAGEKVLKPLTLILPFTEAAELNITFNNTENLEISDAEILNQVVKQSFNHQSELSTDLRYLFLYSLNLKERFILSPELGYHLDELNMYPFISHNDERMKLIRPFIRATEIGVASHFNSSIDINYIERFWTCMNEFTDCNPLFFPYENKENDSKEYKEALLSVMKYITELNKTILMFDTRATVMSGIITFSWKRLIELIDYDLHHTISGRSIIRNLIENLIMIKYLLLNEKNSPTIWEAYQEYGYGQYKLVSERFIEKQIELPESHVPYNLLDVLCQERVRKEYLPMDTNYFNGKSIREKAIEVDCSDLYGLYYDYDSSFEHSLWGAIRESSLLLCDNPSHRYHVIPDIDGKQMLKSVLYDCKKVFYLLIEVFAEVYGIPEDLLERIKV